MILQEQINYLEDFISDVNNTKDGLIPVFPVDGIKLNDILESLYRLKDLEI